MPLNLEEINLKEINLEEMQTLLFNEYSRLQALITSAQQNTKTIKQYICDLFEICGVEKSHFDDTIKVNKFINAFLDAIYPLTKPNVVNFVSTRPPHFRKTVSSILLKTSMEELLTRIIEVEEAKFVG